MEAIITENQAAWEETKAVATTEIRVLTDEVKEMSDTMEAMKLNTVLKEEKTAVVNNKEEMLFDFTSTFKQTTKAGKTFKKKPMKWEKAVTELESPKDIPIDKSDSVNRDLEEDNFIQNDELAKDPEAIEKLIPRNL